MGHCSWNNRVVIALVVSWFRRRNGQQSHMVHGVWGWDRKVLLMLLARNSNFSISGKSPCETKTHANYLFFLLIYLHVDLIQSGMDLLSLKPVKWEVRWEGKVWRYAMFLFSLTYIVMSGMNIGICISQHLMSSSILLLSCHQLHLHNLERKNSADKERGTRERGTLTAKLSPVLKSWSCWKLKEVKFHFCLKSYSSPVTLKASVSSLHWLLLKKWGICLLIYFTGSKLIWSAHLCEEQAEVLLGSRCVRWALNSITFPSSENIMSKIHQDFIVRVLRYINHSIVRIYKKEKTANGMGRWHYTQSTDAKGSLVHRVVNNLTQIILKTSTSLISIWT